MIDKNNLDFLFGATVTDVDGDKIGAVGQIYVDPATDQATWASVKTGLFGTSETFAPLDRATWDDDTVTVPFEKEFVKNAPRVEADGALGEGEEKALYTYYGNGSQAHQGSFADAPAPTSPIADDTQTEGYDTSGHTTDDAMTRSEDELSVGTRTVEAGRPRLRTFVVTEQQTDTVPVSHDELHLVRDPITDANVGNATDGPEISEKADEIVLTADQVVADTTVADITGADTTGVDSTGVGVSADTDGRAPREPRAAE